MPTTRRQADGVPLWPPAAFDRGATMRRIALVAAVLAGVNAGTMLDAAAQQTTGSCSPQKIRYKTSSESVTTSQTGWTNVPYAGIAFTQGGSEPSCVIVRFSAMAAAEYPRWIGLRVAIDGNKIGPPEIASPGEIQFEGYTELSAARSFDFVFPAVAPGKHTIHVQWKYQNPLGIVWMHERTTIIQFQ